MQQMGGAAQKEETTMAKRATLTTEAGAPVIDNQQAQSVGASGPVLLQDHYLIEKLARFNRERIPERVVHAVGTGAYGHLEVTSPDVPKWTKMRIFSTVGKRTPAFVRFSTVGNTIRTAIGRSRTISGTSFLTPRKRPTSSPGSSATAEFPRPIGRWMVSAPIRSNG